MAAGCNRIAYLYDTATGKRARSVCICIVTSNGAKFLVIDGSPMGTFEDQRPPVDDSYIRSVCFTPDNTSLITGAEDKTVKV